MQGKTYYIIGDVHGYYDKLMTLVGKLPETAELVFVGDLIDRGPDAAKVIAFVRENAHSCVLGNHECFMLSQRPVAGKTWEADEDYRRWIDKGGDATLASYGLDDYETLRRGGTSPRLRSFFSDIEWLASLPRYLMLEGCRVNGREVVVSHASVATLWEKRLSDPAAFDSGVVDNREPPADIEGIYNVFGHTPVQTAKIYAYGARIDTGPYVYGTLSALEVPSLNVIDSVE